MPAHSYPHDLALLVRQRWAEVTRSREEEGAVDSRPIALPELRTLEQLLSVCYQASLLHEERRPVTFRMVLAGPEAFAAAGGPPAGLHRLVLSDSRPFDEHELRRLAAGAAFDRALIGVQVDARGELCVWGLVHSGMRWLQAVRGGRRVGQAIPPVLMVAVSGPGRVLVSKGTRTLAALASGAMSASATDVFAAPWLAALFSPLNAAATAERGSVELALGADLARHVLRRTVSTIRAARHGGTLIFLPTSTVPDVVVDNPYLALKYRFFDEEPRRRISSLTAQIMTELSSSYASLSDSSLTPVGWAEYEASANPRIAALDEALFEVAHLVAMLADVDGAVVATDQLEILGFGAEISSQLPDVEVVDRSLDLLGTRRVSERTDRVGTRHRSAYRLCQQLHAALAIVISQDGGVRFVRWSGSAVTYFDQMATGPWEV